MQLQYILNRLRDNDYSEYYSTKPIKGNSKPAQYIPWYKLPEILDGACGGDGYWDLITDVTALDTMVIVKVTITIKDWDGQSVSRSAVGNELIEYFITATEAGTHHKQKEIPYGDATSNASAQAFRRCLALFGVAIDLWERENNTQPGTISREAWLRIQKKSESLV